MEKSTFTYKTKKINENDEAVSDLTAGVFLERINSWVLDGENLFLFLNKDMEDTQPRDEWIKVRVDAKNPSGWKKELQMKKVKEPVTLKITNKEDIERFLNYVNQQSI